jgi:hypothetical protein
MFDWLKKSWARGKQVLGKMRGGVEKGLQIFNKAKDLYRDVKTGVANLPVVGTAAAALITKGEESANKYAKEKTGFNIEDVNRGAAMAERLASVLPKS